MLIDTAIQTSIAARIEEETDEKVIKSLQELQEISKKHSKKLRSLIIQYLCKLITFDQFRRATPMLKPTHRKILRSIFISEFTVVVCLKFAVLAWAKYGKPKLIMKFWKFYDIPPQNKLIDQLIEEGIIEKLQPIAKKLKVRIRPAEFLKKSQETVNLAMPALRYFTKSLRYIYSSNNYERGDILGELVEKAIRIYYENSPFKSEAHMLNLIKNGCEKYAENMREYYTAQRRRRLESRDGVSYENTVISMHRQTESMDGDDSNDVLAEVERNVAPDSIYYAVRELETRLSAQQLIKHYELKKLSDQAKAKAVKLLLGRYIPGGYNDPDYVAFCNGRYKKLRGVPTSSEIQEILPKSKYLKSVQMYLGMSDKNFSVFLSEVRECLV